MSTHPDNSLLRVLKEVADADAALLEQGILDPTRDHVIREGIAVVLGGMNTHLQVLELGFGRENTPQPSPQAPSQSPKSFPEAIHDEIEEIAMECEYLMMEESRLSSLSTDEVAEAISTFQNVKARILVVLQQLEPLQDNIYCRLMVQFLQRAMNNLERLAASEARVKILALQNEMWEIIKGQWPLARVRGTASGGSTDKDAPISTIQKSINDQQANTPAGSHDEEHIQELHRVHSDLLLLNGECSKLLDEYEASRQGKPADGIAQLIFDGEMDKYRQFAMGYMQYLDDCFGVEISDIPSQDEKDAAKQQNDLLSEKIGEHLSGN